MFKNIAELISIFNALLQKAEDALKISEDSILQDYWKLCAGDITYLEMEKW
jgi:hypothetical protein